MGAANVTWGEFVEAGYLREYRAKRVPLPSLRRLIDYLRDKFGVQYPLAHYKPFVGAGRKLLLEAQQVAELPAAFWLVVGAEGHEVLLTPPSESFLERVEFAPSGDKWAERLYPAGKGSPVVMDPDYSSGAPTVEGIRTEALVELVDAGEPIEDVADTFGLHLAALKAALSYEWSRPSAASAA